tara:strand:+ start:266 stop:946 length:681 start_codon:yes stop_codon:yes gene_type:complete
MRTIRIVGLTVLVISILAFISPFYSLYKIGNAVKEKDINTLNIYVVWPEIRDSIKRDVSEHLRNREKLRKKELDNPIEGVFEDIRKVGGELFGGKALDVAIKKVVTPEGIVKIFEIAERKSQISDVKGRDPDTKNSQKSFNYQDYSLEKFNFLSISDFEAKVIAPEGDIYFKMRFVFPRWHLYMIRSHKLNDAIAKKVEDSVDLLKNLAKPILEKVIPQDTDIVSE